MSARILVIVIGLVGSLGMSSIALAERYPDNNRVSVLKGQLVEVGERNRFHYDYPRLNISTNPLGLVSGSYSLSGSYALTDTVAARGDLNLIEKNEDHRSGYEIGAGAQIYFRKMYNGFYLEPGIVRMHRDLDDDGSRYDAFGPQALLGYSWFWDSNFNVAIAGGVGRNLMKSSGDSAAETASDAKNVAGRTFTNGYFRVGYAF